MKKRLKKKLFSQVTYYVPDSQGLSTDEILDKLLYVKDRWRLYTRVAIKEGSIQTSRHYFPVSKYELNKAIEKEMYEDLGVEKDGKKIK